MRVQIKHRFIELHQGDITRQSCDAIVNAANAALAGGGGVDGAIHRRGGPTIMAETRSLYPEGCATGSAVITSAGNLGARYVIHAVGPVWRGGTADEPGLLRSAYRRSLELAREHECRTIAMPALSTGAYGYPLDLAARESIDVACEFLESFDLPEVVRFVLFGDEALEIYSHVLASRGPEPA